MKKMKFLLACIGIVVASVAQVEAGVLMNPATETQLEGWLGQGDLDFTNVFTKSTGDDSLDFHADVDGKGPTISLMKIASVRGNETDSRVGQVIGGYNPQSWTSIENYNQTPTLGDRTAFIFNLHDNVKLVQNDGVYGEYQTYNGPGWGPYFGTNDLVTQGNLESGNLYQYSYGYPSPGGPGAGVNLLGESNSDAYYGGFTEVSFGDFEVYTFAPSSGSMSPVPEPTSLAIFGVMGLIGCGMFHRRSKSRRDLLAGC